MPHTIETIQSDRLPALEEAIGRIRNLLALPAYAEPQAVAAEAEILIQNLRTKTTSLSETGRLAMNGILALSNEVAELRDQLKALKDKNQRETT